MPPHKYSSQDLGMGQSGAMKQGVSRHSPANPVPVIYHGSLKAPTPSLKQDPKQYFKGGLTASPRHDCLFAGGVNKCFLIPTHPNFQVINRTRTWSLLREL
jgi:hypothetical protein